MCRYCSSIGGLLIRELSKYKEAQDYYSTHIIFILPVQDGKFITCAVNAFLSTNLRYEYIQFALFYCIGCGNNNNPLNEIFCQKQQFPRIIY